MTRCRKLQRSSQAPGPGGYTEVSGSPFGSARHASEGHRQQAKLCRALLNQTGKGAPNRGLEASNRRRGWHDHMILTL